MSRLAVNTSTVSYGGVSRIPRRFAQSQTVLPSIQPQTNTMDSGGTAPRKPSRLEQMQANFQMQLMKEKEQKLINLYQDNQQRALQRVNQNKGFARDFFQERRNAGQQYAHNPSMQHMYNKKKNEQQHFGYQGANNSTQVHNNRIVSNGSAKSSAGRDRSNLLAPIKRTNSGQTKPVPTRSKIVRPKTFTGNNRTNVDNREYIPVKSAPNRTAGFDRFSDGGSSDDTPPPNAKQLQQLQQRRKQLQNQQQNNRPPPSKPTQKEGELTDFQKWRMEQDRNRELRLQKQRERIGVIRSPPEDEGYDEEEDGGESPGDSERERNDDIKQKQQELMEQIESQQRELERLRKEREQEQIEEEKQRERRAKSERERKRQMEEAEKERRLQEEEEEERHRREMDAAQARKAELNRQKQKVSRPPSKHQYEYEESDQEDEMTGYQTKTPAPPPGPKPVARRAPPQRHTKPPPSPPVQQEFKGGSHTALYEDALKDADAYGSTGSLKACYNCGRKFAVDRLSKHEKACKNATKKRKVMDPSKLRTAGTEMEQFVNRAPGKPKKSKAEQTKKKNNWRAQHESFVEAIRYAKKVKQIEEAGGSVADLPPPPRSENPDYVQCPHCTRRFNQSAAERHIPHCKNARSRPAPLKRR